MSRPRTPPPLSDKSHCHQPPPSSPFSSTPISDQKRHRRLCSFIDPHIPPTVPPPSSPARNLNQWRTIITSPSLPKHNILKSLIRDGIPSSLRGYLWFHLSDASSLSLQYPSTFYPSLLSQSNPSANYAILKDIGRTFPNNPWFEEREGLGKEALFNILTAYSNFNPSTGYTQGTGFIAAVLLMFQSESDAFYTFLTLMTSPKFEMNKLFCDLVPKVKESNWILSQLIKSKLPRLYDHFQAESVPVDVFSTSWFLTLFFYSFPFKLCLRIFDSFIYQGWKIIFKVGLGLLRLYENELLELDFTGIVKGIQHDLPNKVEPDLLMSTIVKIKIKSADLTKLQADYCKYVNKD
ncbi:hypothetical protein P9112_000523 [Eukaryota sp. TZLM1-RC]